jgi:hypothetical protein
MMTDSFEVITEADPNVTNIIIMIILYRNFFHLQKNSNINLICKLMEIFGRPSTENNKSEPVPKLT